MVYFTSMPEVEISESHLRQLRERAGLSVRELARQIDTHHTNVSYWERTGRIGKSEFLAPVAQALGVTVEEVLGLPRSKQGPTPGGRLGQIFEAASRLPRRQQQKIIEFVEPFVAQHSNGSSS